MDWQSRMDNGWVLSWLILVLCISSRSAIAEENIPTVRPHPNIVVLLTDDQRFDTLGCLGNKLIQTPHIDALAKQGVVFTNCFCTTSICATSRACLLTGQYARRHGIWNFQANLEGDAWRNTFPALLRAQGYRTGFVGKWGVGDKLPKEQYDYFTGFPGQGRYYEKADTKLERHLNRAMSREALEFLAGCSPEQPFCLQVSFKSAHAQDGEPWAYPSETRYQGLYQDVTIPPPPTATERHFLALPKFLQESEGHHRWLPRFATPQLYQSSVKDYYRLITGMDAVVGEIVADLKTHHLLDDTLIIFVSDNGYYLGDYGLADKWFMHEPSIRLPLVIFDPRLAQEQRGSRREQMVLNIDLAPTILAAAGIAIPANMQGRDLSPLLQGKNPKWRDEFFYEHLFEHPAIPQCEGVRTSRWKYVRYVTLDPPVEQLFDLQTDPLEERDLAPDAQHAGQLEALRARWRLLRQELK